MASFCIKCGSELPDDARFCPNCGTSAPGTPGTSQAFNASAAGAGTAGDSRNFQGTGFQQVPPVPPGVHASIPKLDIYFFVPIGVCAFWALLTLLFMGTLMRAGRGGVGLFFLLLNVGLAGGVWKWPYQEYKRGNFQESRKGVIIFGAIVALFALFAIAYGQMITALLDLVAAGSLFYLFYKLGNNSWSF